MVVIDTKLLNPLNDLVFKALFARENKESKAILIDFLNHALDRKGKDRIKEIIHLNPFNLQEHNEDKGSILDLKIKTEAEEKINIEVQLNNVDDFRKRSLYYWAKMYAETIEKGENYTKLRKSIVINLMDFDIIHETERYHTVYKIIEKAEGFELIDDLEIHYIELIKFEEHIEKILNNKELEGIELWLTFLKKAGKGGTEAIIGKLVERSEPIKMAKGLLEEISADELLRQKYYAREKARLDEISRIKYAEMKGMEKGIEKGIEKGMEKGMEKAAKNLLNAGAEISLITRVTGLTRAEIEQLH